MAALDFATTLMDVKSVRKVVNVDSATIDRLNNITHFASKVFNLPIVSISFVDTMGIKLIACCGIKEACDINDKNTFCEFVLKNGDLLIPDLTKDPRFAKLGIVRNPPHLRSYAGTQLIDSNNLCFGVLCVSDIKPREFSDRDIDIINELSRWIELEVHNYDLRMIQGELQKTKNSLKNRVKEITAFFTISKLLENENISKEDYIRKFVKIIPPAWPYPLQTGAQVTVDGKSYKTDNYRETEHSQAAPIQVDGSIIGEIKVCYVPEPTNKLPPPYLSQNKLFIFSLAENLSKSLERIELAQDRKQVSKELYESQRDLSAILQNSFHMSGLLNPDGTLVRVNMVAIDFAGIMESDIVGKKIWDGPWWSHSKEERNKVEEAVLRASHGEFVRYESEIVSWSGNKHIIDFSIKPVKDEMDKVVMIVPEGLDITEKKELEKKQREAENLKEHYQIVSMLSHQLRTPVSAIKVGLESIENNIEDTYIRDELINRVDALNSLIDTLMLYLEIGNSYCVSNTEQFNLTDEVNSVIGGLKDLATKKNVNVSFVNQDEVFFVHGERSRISQVIESLINNAISYNKEKGSVRIEISANQKILKLMIVDTGFGIEKEEQEKIFESFYRSKNASLGGKNQGSGLNLYLSKNIIRAQGGDIGFSSIAGQGSTFWIDLPLSNDSASNG